MIASMTRPLAFWLGFGLFGLGVALPGCGKAGLVGDARKTVGGDREKTETSGESQGDDGADEDIPTDPPVEVSGSFLAGCGPVAPGTPDVPSAAAGESVYGCAVLDATTHQKSGAPVRDAQLSLAEAGGAAAQLTATAAPLLSPYHVYFVLAAARLHGATLSLAFKVGEAPFSVDVRIFDYLPVAAPLLGPAASDLAAVPNGPALYVRRLYLDMVGREPSPEEAARLEGAATTAVQAGKGSGEIQNAVLVQLVQKEETLRRLVDEWTATFWPAGVGAEDAEALKKTVVTEMQAQRTRPFVFWVWVAAHPHAIQPFGGDARAYVTFLFEKAYGREPTADEAATPIPMDPAAKEARRDAVSALLDNDEVMRQEWASLYQTVLRRKEPVETLRASADVGNWVSYARSQGLLPQGVLYRLWLSMSPEYMRYALTEGATP
jgi:hypothetical protein